jgi:thiol-disulfide isomerase/thioredoxin
MESAIFKSKFGSALPYEKYVQTGTDEQKRRWQQVYDAAKLTDAQKNLIGGFVRQMNVLIISGIWCGDCVQQCPLIERIAEVNPAKISLRLVDRDQHRDLAEAFRVNAGDRVPVALMLSEDFELCSAYGDRTINRYRAFAQRYLGPACPTGIVSPDKEELNATLADWLVEIERVQLMLRLSPRLRQKYAD